MDDASSPAPDVAYFRDGKLKYRGARLGSEMHGPWEWFRTDGSLMRTGAFDRGRQIGPWRTYDRAGRVVKETAHGKVGEATR